MLVHAISQSGSGGLTACGIRPEKSDAIATHGERVTCRACLDTIAPYKAPLKIRAKTSNAHYDTGGISTIDVIRTKLTPEQYKGFLLGNAIKYALRLNWKGAAGKDATKLAEYAKWLSENLNQNEELS